jgi:hypothetical protein
VELSFSGLLLSDVAARLGRVAPQLALPPRRPRRPASPMRMPPRARHRAQPRARRGQCALIHTRRDVAGVPAAPPLSEDLEALLRRLRLPISAATHPRCSRPRRRNAGNRPKCCERCSAKRSPAASPRWPPAVPRLRSRPARPSTRGSRWSAVRVLAVPRPRVAAAVWPPATSRIAAVQSPQPGRRRLPAIAPASATAGRTRQGRVRVARWS